MALSLSEPLASRQNSLVREPIVEVISTQFLPDKPFEGKYFNSSTTSERYSEMTFAEDSGRILTLDVRSSDQLWLQYTDEDRTIWSEVMLTDQNATIYDSAVVMLADGNVGITFITSASGRSLRRMVVSQEGTVVTAAATIATYGAPNVISYVGAVLQSDGNYRMVYSHFDGANYSLRTRTSANWTSWGTESTITLTGWTATNPLRSPYLINTTLGGLLLFFEGTTSIRADGTELRNVYYCRSTDNGASWTAPVNITGYTQVGTNGAHPYAAEREDGSIELVYTEENAVLTMDADTEFWEGSGGVWCNQGEDSVTDVFYDEASGLAFFLCIYTYTGTKGLCGIQVVNTATWEVEKSYTVNSVPDYHDVMRESMCWWLGNHGVGQRVAVKTPDIPGIMVLDHENDTIKHYWFKDNVTWNIVRNVEGDVPENAFHLVAVWIEDESNRLYSLWTDTYPYHVRLKVGYIDLSQELGVGEYYQFTELFRQGGLVDTQIYTNRYFVIEKDAGYIIFSSCPQVSNWKGILKIYSLSSGNELYSFRYPENSSFPYGGLSHPVYSNGHIYAGIQYRSDYNQSERRGLADVDLASGSVTYHRPSFSTRDDYGIGKKVVREDGTISMVCYDGIATFDPATGLWELLNGNNVPGYMPGTYPNTYFCIDYMEDKEAFVLGAAYNPLASWSGAAMMSEYGVFKQPQYKTGTFTTGWAFAAKEDLVRGLYDSDAAVAIDDENVMWSKWTRQDSTEYSNKWASEGVTKNVSDLLITSNGVTLQRKIDGGATLDFSCSHGHLFDPNNLLSTWNFVFEKGRKITLRFGETISGIAYWVEQGTFVVDTIKLSYKRGEYPDISVQCKDLSVIWENAKITASQFFSDAPPDEVVSDLLTTYGGLESGNIALPAIATTHDLYCQFIDTDLGEALKELADHFEYFQRFDVSGDYTWRRVQPISGTVNHTYTAGNLIDFTPDDSYSSFTNRVTVKGETRDFMEVLHAEEIVNQLAGTIGWWEKKQTKKVYYSDDGEKTCRDPRLDVLQSIKEFEIFIFKNSDANEYISSEDPNGKWCIVTIESTDYTWLVLAQVAAVIALGALCSTCDGMIGIFSWCGVCILGLTILMSTLFYVLGAVANYSYNVYAKTIGSERLMVQCVADDTEFQQKLGGTVINESIEDPYCYSSVECCRVANYELNVVKAQRRRLSFSKIAHLQDEEGDIIQINHPHTEQAVKVFVTDLTRKFQKPAGAGGGEGGITDQITGWRHVTG